jgi:hypothetical protein
MGVGYAVYEIDHIFDVYLPFDRSLDYPNNYGSLFDLWKVDLLANGMCNDLLTLSNWQQKGTDWRVRVFLPNNSVARECRVGQRFIVRGDRQYGRH